MLYAYTYGNDFKQTNQKTNKQTNKNKKTVNKHPPQKTKNKTISTFSWHVYAYIRSYLQTNKTKNKHYPSPPPKKKKKNTQTPPTHIKKNMISKFLVHGIDIGSKIWTPPLLKQHLRHAFLYILRDVYYVILYNNLDIVEHV